MTTTTRLAQIEANLELLNFVNQRGHADFAALFAAFGDGSDSTRGSSARFTKKLEYLLYTGRLIASGRAKTRVFYIGPEAGKAVSSRGKVNIHAGHASGSDVPQEAIRPNALKFLGEIAAPRKFTTMTDDNTYTPPPQTAMRPGSLDFKRYASYGHQC